MQTLIWNYYMKSEYVKINCILYKYLLKLRFLVACSGAIFIAAQCARSVAVIMRKINPKFRFRDYSTNSLSLK